MLSLIPYFAFLLVIFGGMWWATGLLIEDEDE